MIAVAYFFSPGQLYGHIHKDDFHVQRTSEGKAYALLAPSVSPVYRNNPAFRIVSCDKQGSILDYDQQYMDLVMATGNVVEGVHFLHSFPISAALSSSDLNGNAV